MPQFDPLPLITPRLELRPLRPGDADALFSVFSDPLATRYWSAPAWTTPQQAVERIELDRQLLAEGSALRLALQPRGEPAIVGTVSLFAFDAQSQRAELGYILAPSAWGRGLMHEALKALVDHAFGPLALRRLEADIDPRNERSARTLLRLGFAPEGHLRERWIVAGEVSDSALYGLLAHEWPSKRVDAGARQPGLDSDSPPAGPAARAHGLDMNIERLAAADDPDWLRLRQALWPEGGAAEHLGEMAAFVAQPERYVQFVARSATREAIGLAEASIRSDYVNGTDSTPVAFLEGLYVSPGARGRGVARALVKAVAAWAHARGCAELASDTAADNEASQAVHRRLGFVETERVVYFNQRLEAATAPGSGDRA